MTQGDGDGGQKNFFKKVLDLGVTPGFLILDVA